MSVAIQAHNVIDKLYFKQVGKKLYTNHLAEKE